MSPCFNASSLRGNSGKFQIYNPMKRLYVATRQTRCKNSFFFFFIFLPILQCAPHPVFSQMSHDCCVPSRFLRVALRQETKRARFSSGGQVDILSSGTFHVSE